MEEVSIEELFEEKCYQPAMDLWLTKFDEFISNNGEQAIVPLLEAIGYVLKKLSELGIYNMLLIQTNTTN